MNGGTRLCPHCKTTHNYGPCTAHQSMARGVPTASEPTARRVLTAEEAAQLFEAVKDPSWRAGSKWWPPDWKS